MSASSNHIKAFVQCCHGKHVVASSRTLLSDHVMWFGSCYLHLGTNYQSLFQGQAVFLDCCTWNTCDKLPTNAVTYFKRSETSKVCKLHLSIVSSNSKLQSSSLLCNYVHSFSTPTLLIWTQLIPSTMCHIMCYLCSSGNPSSFGNTASTTASHTSPSSTAAAAAASTT